MDSGVTLLIKLIRVAGFSWLSLYTCFCLVFGLFGNVSLHIMMIGLLVAFVAWFRLPPPNPSYVRSVLGQEPRPDMKDCDVDWEVAHRAACLDAPENSIEALRLAHCNGARMVEFDVSFTSCMSAVIFHDDEVDRITPGVGNIKAISRSNLKKLNLATKHPMCSQYDHHVAIPDLEDFVNECIQLNMKMIIDLKTWEYIEETTSVILDLYKKYPGLKTTSIVTSFFPQLLYSLRSKNPDILCSISTRPHFLAFSSFDGCNGSKPRYVGIKFWFARFLDILYPWLLKNIIYDLLGLSAVLIHHACVTPQYVSDWRRKGVRVMAWTVNDPLLKAHLRHNLGVQCLTDTLERVKPDNWVLRE